MGWKSVIRSMNAEINRQARESDRRNRKHLKEVEREEATETVLNQENYLQTIISLHQECRADLDWNIIKKEPEPKKPVNTKSNTKRAAENYNRYKPNVMHKVLNIENRSKRKLSEKLQEAKEFDKNKYAIKLSAYKGKMKKWEKMQKLSERIPKSGKTLLEVIQEHVKVSDLFIGKNVQFNISDDMEVDINLMVFPYDEIIPDEKYSLRQSGTLSIKKCLEEKD